MPSKNKKQLPQLHLNIIKFFHENQASIDTPRGVSTWVREERSKVSKALEELVKLKMLTAHRSTSTTGYSYTRDPKIISKIEKLLNKRKTS
jgi:predicted transcriptional regulator